LRFFRPFFWTPDPEKRTPKTGPPGIRKSEKSEKSPKKGEKSHPLKPLTMKKVGVLISTPVLVQKTPPLKPVRNFGVRNLVRGIKKGPKNTPAKTGYDEKVGV